MFKKITRPKVLALGAHPDDIELGAGGFIYRLVKEARAVIHFAILTHGKSHWLKDRVFDEDQRVKETHAAVFFLMGKMDDQIAKHGRSDQDVNRLINDVRKETEKHKKYLGKRIHFGGFTDRKLRSETPECIRFIEDLLKTISPDIVITHSDKDLHDDHRVVHDSTLSAARDYRGMILDYQSPSTKPFELKPTFCCHLTEEMLFVKRLATFSHQSERDREPRFMTPSYLTGLASSVAEFHRMPDQKLEAFEVYQSFWPLRTK